MNHARLILQRMSKHVAMLVSLSDIVKRSYEKGGPKDRIRLNEVACHVADELDVCVSPPLRANVKKAAALLGHTRIVKSGNVRYYLGVKRKEHNDES